MCTVRKRFTVVVVINIIINIIFIIVIIIIILHYIIIAIIIIIIISLLLIINIAVMLSLSMASIQNHYKIVNGGMVVCYLYCSSRYFLLCLQADASSFRLLRVEKCGCVVILYFSNRQRWQVLFLGEYDGAVANIFHVMLCLMLPSFSFQMCSLSVVACSLFLFLNDDRCSVYLVLKEFAEMPTYVCGVLLFAFVTVAWYTMFLVVQVPSTGHSALFRQLQGLSICVFCSVFLFSICLLCADIMCLMFCIQL